jgi:hypothetical protein
MIVADYLWRGWSAEEIARQYPYLTLGEVHAAMTYFFDHRDEIEDELVAEYRDVEEWKKKHPTPCSARSASYFGSACFSPQPTPNAKTAKEQINRSTVIGLHFISYSSLPANSSVARCQSGTPDVGH